MKVIKILDIDLDFFLDNVPKGIGAIEKNKRQSSQDYHPWEPAKVIELLETSFRLEKDAQLTGMLFEHHDEVFWFLSKLQAESDYNLIFSIDHLDGHADLGFGDTSYIHICTDLLFKPKEERYKNLQSKVTEGNFLAYLIACGWVKELNYINHPGQFNDAFWIYFQNFEYKTEVIKMPALNKSDIDDVIRDRASSIPKINPKYEPTVPCRLIEYASFNAVKQYDYLFLTKSPEYTPVESDSLIPLIMNYSTPT
jgi:hypothetical protein